MENKDIHQETHFTAPQKDFTGEVAIVTGAGQGIGFEICRQLAGRGCAVLLNDVDASLASAAASKISESGGVCSPFGGDVADVEVLDQMVHQAVETYGHLSLLVANAGITLFGNFFSYAAADFQRVMEVNLKGTFFLVQAAARQMREQGNGGRVVLMSSVTGHQAHQDLAAYGMTKAALEMLAKSLVIELSPFRININAIAPGATLTERTTQEDPGYEQEWSTITPLGRPALPADIAQAALFLLSPGASHITGQSLVVDGGWTSISPQPKANPPATNPGQ